MHFSEGSRNGAPISCKCCSAESWLYGAVDFHKNCLRIPRDQAAFSANPIFYFRCTRCHFIFTTAFDEFTMEDFHRDIYNEDYHVFDPDYERVRPEGNASTISQLFANIKPKGLIDYGGGNGVLADLLRAAGFPRADTYDPFVPRFSTRPAHRYDCVVSFEVAEHSTNPAFTFAEMSDLLTDPGLILFSTLLQPADIDRQGLAWWYAAPRNGHVSLYTRASVEALIQPHGLRLASFNDHFHALFRGIPECARSFAPIHWLTS